MTVTRFTGAQLQAHAREVARTFKVRLCESAIAPDEAYAIVAIRTVVCAPITDETTYAVALHELGHVVAPNGSLPGQALTRVEEEAAWNWARHIALEWTEVMDHVARWAEGTYAADVPPPVAPAAPTRIDWTKQAAPRGRVQWKEWK